MKQHFKKLAELNEAVLDKLSEEERISLWLTTNYDFMSQTNSLLQKNLDNWTYEKTREYGQRMTYYSHVNQALTELQDKGRVIEKVLDNGILSIKKLLNHVMDEYTHILNSGTEKKKQQLIEEVLLPHYMIIRFLESYKNI